MSEIIITTELSVDENIENCKEIDENSVNNSGENVVKFMTFLGDEVKDDTEEKRHHSDPGNKPKRPNLRRTKHLSRSFGDFKNGHNNGRRLSSPEEKLCKYL